MSPAKARQDLRELAVLFLRLGTTAFGGPTAHIAMMEEEVVVRRQWLSRQGFLDLVSASNLIPGPNSTELAIHIGWQRARWTGLVVAGLSFLLPATLLVWGIAVLYVSYGTLPAASGLLAGVKPVVLGIVLVALVRLARSALASKLTRVLAVVSLLAIWSGLHELVVLGACASVAWFDGRFVRGGQPWQRAILCLPLAQGARELLTEHAQTSLTALFLVFAKIGSVLFGSGYVLLAFLRSDLVVRLGWLTEAQLLDAVAVGQFTPGPVFTTATFVGYVVAGHAGALVATAGIFLPAFVFVALSAPVLARWRANPDLRRVFDGLNAASLALMAFVTIQLAPNALGLDGSVTTSAANSLPNGWRALAALMCASVVLLVVRTRVNSAWLVLAGGMIGSLAVR